MIRWRRGLTGAWLVMMAFLASVLLTACAAPPPTAAPSTVNATAIPASPTSVAPTATVPCQRPQLQTDPEIAIGAIYPLSNTAFMANGIAMQAATELAVRQINAQGGVNGKLLYAVIYDSASDPAQGARMAEKLITVDCVAALIGVFSSDVALAVKAVAIEHHIPILFADPYADEITADQALEVFRIAPTYTMLLQLMGGWLQEIGDYNQDGKQSVVMLMENTPSGQERLARVQEILPALGINLTGFLVDLPMSDFSPVIARIVALERLPDVIFIYFHNGEVIPMVQQLLQAGIGPTRQTLLVATSQVLDQARFWQAAPNGNYVIGIRIGPWPNSISPLGQTFATEFAKQFQRWPEASAFEAYDTVWLIADALTRADRPDADALIRALEATDRTLAAGHYTFPYGQTNPPDGVTVSNYLWHQWPDPPVLYLQYTEPNQPADQMTVIWPPTYQTADSPLAPALAEHDRLLNKQQ